MTQVDADAGGGHCPDDELTFTADVDQTGPGRNRDGQRGQDDGHGPQQDLGQRDRLKKAERIIES